MRISCTSTSFLPTDFLTQIQAFCATKSSDTNSNTPTFVYSLRYIYILWLEISLWAWPYWSLASRISGWCWWVIPSANLRYFELGFRLKPSNQLVSLFCATGHICRKSHDHLDLQQGSRIYRFLLAHYWNLSILVLRCCARLHPPLPKFGPKFFELHERHWPKLFAKSFDPQGDLPRCSLAALTACGGLRAMI